MRAPHGFVRHETPNGELWLARGFERGAEELGLDDYERWEHCVAGGIPAGRGRVAFVEAGRRRVAVKKLRRGGRYGGVWRDRFPSRSRLFANLVMPTLARERGIPTPEPLALLLLSGPPGFWRGWFALEAVPNSVDLMRRVRERPPSHEEWACALALVRRVHDAGILHPDLNLGNLLIDDDRRAWVIDMDRCQAQSAPLDANPRIDAIRRLERSYYKTCCLSGKEPNGGLDWLTLYGGGDAELRARWDERTGRDRAHLERHRRTWG